MSEQQQQQGKETEHSEWFDRTQPEPADYHLNYIDGVSHSMLNVFRNSIQEFHKRFILKESDWKRTKAMDFGSAFHCWMLERDRWDKQVATQPNHNKVGKANREAWNVFMEENKWKAWISEEDMVTILEMERAILSDSEAYKWMSGLEGRNEKMISWGASRDVLGVNCNVKCKPDRLIPKMLNEGMDTDVIVDLKTPNDVSPESIAKSCASFNYHCQAALYIEGVKSMNGGDPCRHISVFITKKAPFEIACVEYDREALALGRYLNKKTLIELAKCLEEERFDGRTSHQLMEVGLPRWYVYKYQNELDEMAASSNG